MRWTPGGVSSNIEDRRGASGFGFGRGPTIGCGGAIILLVLSLLTGKNFFALFDGSGGGQVQTASGPQTAPPADQTPEEQRAVQFVSFVLDDLQKTWPEILQQQGVPYRNAKLVLYRDMTQSACGTGQAQSGPFYCPVDEKVYIDLAFNDELDRRFGAPGDFAQAYVIAHEIGHHVQNILGLSERVHRAMEENPREAKEYSIRLELQADCYAGIWGHSTNERNLLEAGDVDEGLSAAAAVGDDNIQKMTGRAVNPDSFTHGSSQQRVEWFRRGFDTGRLESCDTFR